MWRYYAGVPSSCVLPNISWTSFTNSAMVSFSSSPRSPSLNAFNIFVASASPFFGVHLGGLSSPPNLPPLPRPRSQPLPRPRPRYAPRKLPLGLSSGSGSMVAAYTLWREARSEGCVFKSSWNCGFEARAEKSIFCLR
jgi:hypothetical protein